MKSPLLIMLTTLGLCLTVAAQNKPSQLQGKVVDRKNNPVSNLELIPSNGDPGRTNKDGTFTLSFYVGPGKATTIRVGGKWAISEPFAGRFTTQSPDNVSFQTIKVLPKGSPEFVAPDQMILVAREVVGKQLNLIRTLQKENKELTTEKKDKNLALDEANQVIAQLQADLAKSQVIREYADQTGYSYDTIAAALERWANTQYKGYAEQDEAVQRSLRGDVEGASSLALKAMRKRLEDVSRLSTEIDRVSAVKIKVIRDALFDAQLAAQAPQGQGDWASALTIYDTIDKTISSEPNFKEVLRSEWATLRVSLVLAKGGLAAISTSSERARLFSEALKHCEEAITIYKQESDPTDWGVVQLLWGNIQIQVASDLRGEEQRKALIDGATRVESVLNLNPTASASQNCTQLCWEGVRVVAALVATAVGHVLGGERGDQLLKNGSAALEKSLTTFRLDSNSPMLGANRYLVLGVSQLVLGWQTSGKEGLEHLRVAKENLEKALDGKDALVGSNRSLATLMLADTLLEAGQRSAGKESTEQIKAALPQYSLLLPNCVASEPTSRCDSLVRNISFAILLLSQKGETTAALSAIRSFIDSLDRQLKLLPADSDSDIKLILQFALGKAFLQFGELLESEEGIARIWAGIESLDRSLTLLPENKVQERASIQMDILASLFSLGRRVGMDKVVARINVAVTSVETLVKNPNQWQLPALCFAVQISLGMYLRMVGQEVGGEEGRQKMESAVRHVQTALNGFSSAFDADEWSHGNSSLGDCLLAFASSLPKDQARPKVDEAAQAYERALTVLTPASAANWAHVRLGLAGIKFQLAMELAGDEGRRQREAALQMFVETAADINRGEYPIEWGMAQSTLGRARATAALQQDTPEKVRTELLAAIKSFEAALTVQYPGTSVFIWTQLETDYGRALSSFADRLGDEPARNHANAIKAYEQALTIPAAKVGLVPRAFTQINLAHSLSALGSFEAGRARLDKLQVAAKDFDEALLILPPNKDWAQAQVELGQTRYALAQYDEPVQAANNVAAAIRAYDQALPLFSSGDTQWDWAATNGDLGDSLVMAGWLSGGRDRVAKWKRAVGDYEKALQVYKPNSDAAYWGQANAGLGSALLALGTIRGTEKETNLKRAVQSFQKAISVYMTPGYDEPLKNAKNGLGDTYFQLRQTAAAAKAYEEVRAIDSNNQRAIGGLSGVSHELTYNYPEAVRLQEKLLEIDPKSLDAQAGLAEAYFTAGRFPECEQLLSKLLAESDLNGNTRIAMRTIRILNTLALGHNTQVPEQTDLLISEVESQSADFQLDWWFDGTRHFISQQRSLSIRQRWFSLLFTALASENRDSIAAKLKQAKAQYKL